MEFFKGFLVALPLSILLWLAMFWASLYITWTGVFIFIAAICAVWMLLSLMPKRY